MRQQIANLRKRRNGNCEKKKGARVLLPGEEKNFAEMETVQTECENIRSGVKELLSVETLMEYISYRRARLGDRHV